MTVIICPEPFDSVVKSAYKWMASVGSTSSDTAGYFQNENGASCGDLFRVHWKGPDDVLKPAYLNHVEKARGNPVVTFVYTEKHLAFLSAVLKIAPNTVEGVCWDVVSWWFEDKSMKLSLQHREACPVVSETMSLNPRFLKDAFEFLAWDLRKEKYAYRKERIRRHWTDEVLVSVPEEKVGPWTFQFGDRHVLLMPIRRRD